MDSSMLQEMAAELEPDIISIRRYLHQYPELGFKEQITSRFVADYLEKLGMKVSRGIAGTGVVAILDSGRAGPCIAVRADMDALPLQEVTGLPFSSRHDGVMHACGHDGHMAMALGAANMLVQAKDKLKGIVKFIFQPAEEMLGGAKHMIQAGVLELPTVDGIIGLHLWPDLPTGQFGVKQGAIMASMDHVELMIHGQSGHGAAPHQAVDAIVVSAQVLTALQALVSRESDPADQVVVSMGMIQGGALPNIIAEQVQIMGTVRTVNAATRQRMKLRLTELVTQTAGAMNGSATVGYEYGYPATVNNAALTQLAQQSLLALYGPSSIHSLSHSQMTSEDMAYYMENIPGVFLLVGAGGSSKGEYPLHHPKMNIDERALRKGALLLAQFVIDYLLQKAV